MVLNIARLDGKEIGAISTLILRDRLASLHKHYGLNGSGSVSECILPRRSVSSDYLAYSDGAHNHPSDKNVVYAIIPRAIGEGETLISHWEAKSRMASVEHVSSEFGAEQGYVFAATLPSEPRTINYLIVPPVIFDFLKLEGVLVESKAGRLTANFGKAFALASAPGANATIWERALIQVKI